MRETVRVPSQAMPKPRKEPTWSASPGSIATVRHPARIECGAMDTAANRSAWVGRIIDDKYKLLQWLGGSSDRYAFLTEQPGEDAKKAAVILVPADAEDADDYTAGWALATRLSHPHLVHPFYTGLCDIDSEPLNYVVTEFPEEDLSQILPERALTPAETREMLLPVLDALSYLHAEGIVHGDLKPSNIVVVDNEVKLAWDSLHIGSDNGENGPVHTPYEAPEEQLETTSTAADVWSLGITLVEALTQHPPAWDIAKSADPIVPSTVPQPFAGIARDCLRGDPAQRTTLSDIKARLAPTPAAPKAEVEHANVADAKRRVMILVAVAVVLLAVFGIVELRSHKTQPTAQVVEQQPAPVTPIAPPPSRNTSATEAPKHIPVPRSMPTRNTPPTPKPLSGAVKGTVSEQIRPDILASASRTIHGQVSVSVRVYVDPTGAVSNAELVSPGPSRYFAKVALQAAQRWKFNPAQVDEKTVPSVWTVRFKFRRSGVETTSEEVTP
jgi:TonB family protein